MRFPRAYVFLVTIAAAAVVAQEKSGASATAEEDSIAVAKREFELVRASRDAAVQPRPDLPRLAVPELHSGAAEPRVWTPNVPAGEKQSSNWLLDAMERKSESRLDRHRGRSPADSPLPGTETLEDEKREPRRDPQSRENDDDPKRVDAFNPLSQYLAGWMSPQDYALLAPTLQKSARDDVTTSPGTTFSPPSLDSVALSRGHFGPGALTPQYDGISRLAPQENPYLQTLNLPAPPSAPVASASVPPAVSGRPAPPAGVFAAPPPPTPPRAQIPDFAKPQTNEQHYKQMKRF